ncbi:hypothetical protein LCGC14_0163360 [marine sediment metagenome]|uniref:Uncharacterized protein n=1 Tax=marine sediment metagenome TaxID=412755 RepID=A0A0F9VA94_9ZZZZ
MEPSLATKKLPSRSAVRLTCLAAAGDLEAAPRAALLRTPFAEADGDTRFRQQVHDGRLVDTIRVEQDRHIGLPSRRELPSVAKIHWTCRAYRSMPNCHFCQTNPQRWRHSAAYPTQIQIIPLPAE